MPEGTTTIRCPYCGYPYPMSKLQLDVYIGRSMGCMNCGKSFPVVAPPPPPPPQDDLLQAGSELVEARRQAAIAAGESAALPPEVDIGRSPAAATQEVSAPGGLLAVLPIAAGALFMALAAVAAVIGYSGSSDNAIKAVSRSQTPMTLLWISYIVAAVGLVAGSIHLARTRGLRRQPGRRVRLGVAATGTIVCLTEFVLASLLALMVLPRLNEGLAEVHRAACQTNLQTIGYALIASASDRSDGRFPDSLGDLIGTGGLQADVVVCPSGGHAAAPIDLPQAEKARLVAAGQHLTYVYLGKGLAMRSAGGRRVSTHTVLAYEPPGLHGDPEGFHVLFADGAVVFATKERATKLIAELKAGQNPPPTAQAVKP
ncbi:hypothetical protein [Humisphaera borealis]|uniref:Uncharacterized protein n=1 Tax=Humisphaera borealis TaxID=2807512 RepID=A0A7M2X2H8_9BACT|nr:hypothetical protein [Humisphaera borealis]QOV91967.1 hypothetical protein IPV69_11675 [Humisphaera borealis]